MTEKEKKEVRSRMDELDDLGPVFCCPPGALDDDKGNETEEEKEEEKAERNILKEQQLCLTRAALMLKTLKFVEIQVLIDCRERLEKLGMTETEAISLISKELPEMQRGKTDEVIDNTATIMWWPLMFNALTVGLSKETLRPLINRLNRWLGEE